MITVKFFGMVGSGKSIVEIDRDEITVNQVFQVILKDYPEFTEKQLEQAVLFVNRQQITGRKRLSIVLKDSDELALLSPASGG